MIYRTTFPESNIINRVFLTPKFYQTCAAARPRLCHVHLISPPPKLIVSPPKMIVSPPKLIVSPPKVTVTPPNMIVSAQVISRSDQISLKCEVCLKCFSRMDGLKRHLSDGRCPGTPFRFGCGACGKDCETRGKLLRHRKRCQGAIQPYAPPAQAAIQAGTGTINNIQNQQNIQTQQNIQNQQVDNNTVVLQFGQENCEYVVEYLQKAFEANPYSLYKRLLANPATQIANTARLLHFNPSHPEHWNVRQLRPSEKFIKVWCPAEKAWLLQSRDDVYETMISMCGSILEEVNGSFDENRAVSIDQLLLDSKEHRKHTLRKLEEVVLNGTQRVLKWIQEAYGGTEIQGT